MAHKHSIFDDHHHHHHHHEHVEYRRPFNLTTELGLFALKKLDAMNPDILREREKRLLNPSAPGVLTHVVHATLSLATPIFAYSVWRNFGAKYFLRPQVFLPLGVLVGVNIGFQNVANYMRELTLTIPRGNLVSHYKNQYGESFLLDVLDPAYRLPDSLASR